MKNIVWQIVMCLLMTSCATIDEGNEGNGSAKIGILKDTRDGQVYHTATFGDAGEWMTENLSYEPPMAKYALPTPYGPPFYDYAPYYYSPNGLDQAAGKKQNYNGGRLGFLYTWAAAMNFKNGNVLEDFSNQSMSNQGICPSNWHLPTDDEWDILEVEIAANPVKYSTLTEPFEYYFSSGQAFKSTISLDEKNATDGFSKAADDGGFNVLLVGEADYYYKNRFWGTKAYFWTSVTRYEYPNDVNTTKAFCRSFNAPGDFFSGWGIDDYSEWKHYLFSVRCVKNKTAFAK
ncbi:MAG: hypothetical protein LBN93_04250 [Candidatus Symbiothrix sp.]|jgi:uncharacterized protein (TIGR02145 family)|nr:hypothetical protein [Candidatus Symbiothrix sp.]